jgi:hypothetical protein
MDQSLMLRIRERAYHIWAANGGGADQNWLRAETKPQQFRCRTLRGAAPEKAARRPQAEGKEGGFSWASRFAVKSRAQLLQNASSQSRRRQLDAWRLTPPKPPTPSPNSIKPPRSLN